MSESRLLETSCSTTTAFGTRASLINLERSSLQLLAIKAVDRGLALAFEADERVYLVDLLNQFCPVLTAGRSSTHPIGSD
jgi:hypothetical protein